MSFIVKFCGQDWRWAEDRDDSYWYPDVVQLFRQQTDGEWEEVIARVRHQ